MLRRQSPDRTPMSFLSGSSDMARRLREFDWPGHPLGAPEDWPASLRAALDICLNSAFPTAIYWGSDLRLLYNDAWAHIPGPRHPACLGEPAREVWSDIWHVIEPQFIEVIETGEGLFLDDQFLPMKRFGVEEETYWSYSFTPISGADGAIEGIFNSGMETTAKVLKQRQTGFLLGLSDTLRRCAGPHEVMQTACRELGRHLGAIRVGLREVDRVSADLPVRTEWCAPGVDPVAPVLAWSSLHALARRMTGGRIVRIGDTGTMTEEIGARLRALGAGSVLAVPWTQGGDLQAVLFVHRAEVRDWTDEDVSTVEQVFSRTIHALEGERAAEREKAMTFEIEHRARNMLAVAQAIIRNVRAPDIETLRASIMDRMGALAGTLSLMSGQNWKGARLHDILDGELDPYLPAMQDRIRVDGPPTFLVPRMAQPITMALHELTTNAVKYGALSVEDGRLDVAWQVRPDRILQIDWRETGGQPFDAATGNGFGTRLLALTVEGQLGGRLTRSAAGGGFHCRMEVPADVEAAAAEDAVAS